MLCGPSQGHNWHNIFVCVLLKALLLTFRQTIQRKGVPLGGWLRKRHPIWAVSWVVKHGLAFTTTYSLDSLPHVWQPQELWTEAQAEPYTFSKPHLANNCVHLQNFYMHYAISFYGPKLLACAGSSIYPEPSIRSDTEETGPEYQWKCFTNYTAANEISFMCVNLARLSHCIFD